MTKIYDKRDDFNFNIVNFPFLDSNIPSSPSYGVYISPLLRYARASSHYCDFINRSSQLTSKLIERGFSILRLKHTFKKFYGHHMDVMAKYDRAVSLISNDLFG